MFVCLQGRRRCPGERVAREEFFVFLAEMLRAFRFDNITFDEDGQRGSDCKSRRELDPLDRSYFGLNHVPRPFSLRVTRI